MDTIFVSIFRTPAFWVAAGIVWIGCAWWLMANLGNPLREVRALDACFYVAQRDFDGADAADWVRRCLSDSSIAEDAKQQLRMANVRVFLLFALVALLTGTIIGVAAGGAAHMVQRQSSDQKNG